MEWIEKQRPESTTRNYQRYSREFLRYATEKQLNPKSPVAVASFMKYCITDRPRRLGRTTVAVTIPSSVAALYRYSQSQPQNSVLVREMKKAVVKNTPTPGAGRKPLTMKILLRLVMQVDLASMECVRNFFMVLLMMVALLRESEAVHLQNEDVWAEEVDGHQVLHVFIQKSKTDQEGDGHTVVVGEGENVLLCPVRWFYKYRQLRGDDDGPFFYSMDKGTRRALADNTPNFIVKKLLTTIGVEAAQYGSHSCRKGGCTAAIEAGTDMRLVARHGRWRSSAINTYIVDSVASKLSVSKAILQDE